MVVIVLPREDELTLVTFNYKREAFLVIMFPDGLPVWQALRAELTVVMLELMSVVIVIGWRLFAVLAFEFEVVKEVLGDRTDIFHDSSRPFTLHIRT